MNYRSVDLGETAEQFKAHASAVGGDYVVAGGFQNQLAGGSAFRLFYFDHQDD
jgi:hypothetical protein